MNMYRTDSEDEDHYYDPHAEKLYQRLRPGREQRISNPREENRAKPKQTRYDSDEESKSDFIYQATRKETRPEKVKKKNADTNKVLPEELVHILSKFQDFKASFIELFEDHELHPAMIRKVAETNPHTFSINKHNIFLRPRVSICCDHMEISGCPSISECDSFHICYDYLLGTCNNECCPFGHKWKTKHNSDLLLYLHLHKLPTDSLRKLATIDTRSKICQYPLDICLNYNNERCSRRDCKRLHLCLSFVTNSGKCTKTTCHLNHDIKARHCQQLLNNHGIPTDETPRDTLHTLVSLNPKLKQLIARNKSAKPRHTCVNKNNQPTKCNTAPSRMPINQLEKNQARIKSLKPKSTWSNEIRGDVAVPEICFDSVEGKCKDEVKGCPKLHAKLHFHWQIAGEDMKWYNFPDKVVMHLEHNFCDPSCNVIGLPFFATSTLDSLENNMLKLLGGDTWKADFESMTLHNISQNRTLKLRRLCTEKTSMKAIKENTYVWYFKDINHKWILYGDMDSTQNVKRKSSLSSTDIEKQFSENPSGSLKFSISRFDYILDFTNMCQTNLRTNVIRKVSRRPYPHHLPVKKHNSFQTASTSGSSWAHQQNGDVKIPDICFDSVESSCKYETAGCTRLHAKRHYCWQISRNGSSWLNLQPDQAKVLELAFCDPNEDTVTIPSLDDSDLEFPSETLLGVMSKSAWTANFQSMQLCCSSLRETLQLRRLCSQIVPECSIRENEYHWYFKDINSKWILYGQYDSTKKVNMRSSVCSKSIEKQFMENPFVKISFKTGCYSYVLDCSKMIQINLNTKQSRDVRQRPKPHIRECGELSKSTINIPTHWEIMSQSEIVRTVKLSHCSSEYKKITALFQGTLPSGVKVVKISRIQNPKFWKEFQKKILSVESHSGKKVCQLFHGTSQELLPMIFYDNFDARTNGCPTKGIPFSQDAAGAYKYCKTNKNGYNYLIVSSVLLDNSATHPINMLGGFGLFLRMLDNGQWKKDVTEIYPEYVLKLSSNVTKKTPC